jgi:hypothetical protein
MGKKKGSNAQAGMTSPLHSHLFATLRAAVDLQKKKAMYEPNDMVGILLFNTVRIFQNAHSACKLSRPWL